MIQPFSLKLLWPQTWAILHALPKSNSDKSNHNIVIYRFFEINVARLRSESPEQPTSSDSSKQQSISPQIATGHNSTRLEQFLSKEKQHLLETERRAQQVIIN